MQASHDSLAGHLIDAVNARFIARDLERSFAKHGRNVKITIDLTGEGWPHDVSVDRGRNIYKITYSASARRRFVLPARHSLLAYLYWMDCTPANVTRMTINAGDGDSPSRARFAPSAPRSKHVAIPDPHFFQHHAFQAERLRVPDTPAWETRSDQVVWRGGSNGPGQISIDHADQDNPLVVPRMRLCLKVQGDSRFDVRMVRIGADGGIWTEPARQVGLIGDHIAAASWLTRKYAIDIDGFSNTWSNFFIRMLLGCCVFKVESQLGFRQWYYDRVLPFEHYVPILPDMSDLAEKVEWAKSHPNEARAIADNAQRFALGLDFETGKNEAVDLITAEWDQPVS